MPPACARSESVTSPVGCRIALHVRTCCAEDGDARVLRGRGRERPLGEVGGAVDGKHAARLCAPRGRSARVPARVLCVSVRAYRKDSAVRRRKSERPATGDARSASPQRPQPPQPSTRSRAGWESFLLLLRNAKVSMHRRLNRLARCIARHPAPRASFVPTLPPGLSAPVLLPMGEKDLQCLPEHATRQKSYPPNSSGAILAASQRSSGPRRSLSACAGSPEIRPGNRAGRQ